MSTDVHKMNLQLFAEGEMDDDDETGGGEPTPVKTVEKVEVVGKTYSEDYVKTIRGEAKANRIAKKTMESLLREALGVGEDVELSKETVTSFKKKQNDDAAALLAQANGLLLKAEIKNLDGYDSKLLERLIDKSKLEIEPDGSIKGLAEAAEAIALEFPQVKLTAGSGSGKGTNPDRKENLVGIAALQAQYDQAVKDGNVLLQISLKNKMFEEQNK